MSFLFCLYEIYLDFLQLRLPNCPLLPRPPLFSKLSRPRRVPAGIRRPFSATTPTTPRSPPTLHAKTKRRNQMPHLHPPNPPNPPPRPQAPTRKEALAPKKAQVLLHLKMPNLPSLLVKPPRANSSNPPTHPEPLNQPANHLNHPEPRVLPLRQSRKRVASLPLQPPQHHHHNQLMVPLPLQSLPHAVLVP